MRLIVYKSLRRLELHSETRLIATFAISLGFSPIGKKRREGDGRTPEGEYRVAVKNPKSKYYLSLGLNYPNPTDAAEALQAGTITEPDFRAILLAHRENRLPPQKTPLGGEIYIHGGGINGDWTEGCIALRDGDVLQLFETVPILAEVLIFP